MKDADDMNQRILGNISTAVVLLDCRLHVVFCNPAAEALLRISSSQSRGQPVTELIGNREALTQPLHDALGNGQSYTQRKARLPIQAGEEITADLTVTPVHDSPSPMLLLELAPLDRYLRIDRDAALAEHSEVSRMMVRSLAHEIKNPLGGIKGSAQLLARELGSDSLREYTNIIVEETTRLTSLVDRMLGPNSLPAVSATNIHQVLERAATLIELEAEGAFAISRDFSISRDFVISRDYDPSIPEIEADAELLLQAVLNLVRNAMQSVAETPDPAVTITTRIERQFTVAGKRHRIVLRVDIADNGPGIPEGIREHLFLPMVTRRPGGTGLGLTLAQNIINQHGGLIECESEPGNTVFSLFIPLSRQVATAKKAPAKRSPTERGPAEK